MGSGARSVGVRLGFLSTFGLLLIATTISTLAAGPPGAGNPAFADGTGPAWLARIQEMIRREEYNVSWQGNTPFQDLPAAWQSPNRAQDLRVFYACEGVRVVPRTAAEPHWFWALGTHDAGLSEGRQPAISGNLVEYSGERATELFTNEEGGLHHEITLYSPPPGDGPSELATFALGGTLLAFPSEDGQSVAFATPGGAAVLRYSLVCSRNAQGNQAQVFIGVRPGDGGSPPSLILLADANSASYPLVVEGLVTSPAWTVEGDQVNAYLGSSVSTAGDVSGDGYSDTIVGAPGYDAGEAEEGRIFVYYGSPSGLSSSPNWTAESNQSNALLGAVAGTAGDVNGDGYSDIIVSAHHYSNGQAFEGAVFVWYGSAAGLGLPGTPANADWTGEGNLANAWLGFGLAGTAGDVNGDGYSDVIAGSYNYALPDAREGAAFVWLGSASGLNVSVHWWAQGDVADMYFATSGGTAGDVNGDGYADIIVGAMNYTHGESNEGAAFIWYGSGTGLGTSPTNPATANWVVEGNSVEANLGKSCMTAGDVNGDGYADVIVGSPGYNFSEGQAHVYLGSGAGPSTTADWTGGCNGVIGRCGDCVATAGDVNGDGYADVIVAAPTYSNGSSSEGAAFVYQGSSSGLGAPGTPANADWSAEGGQAGAWFGASAATAGDVNGDGYSDVIVGAPYFNGGLNAEGKAFLYYGSPDGLPASWSWGHNGVQSGSWYGYSVAGAGDVNGDGFADVLIGAPHYNSSSPGTQQGRVWLFLGISGGIGGTPAWIADGLNDDQFGFSVAGAGDVNGDGFDDVIIGAPYYSNGQAGEGGAFVWFGSLSVLGDDGNYSNADWRAEGDSAGALLGTSVASAGDVNGDGYLDVIAGAPYYDNGNDDEGVAFAWYGSASGPNAGVVGTPANAPWAVEGNQGSAHMGQAVGSAGDVNGDGYSDAFACAPWFSAPQANEGKVSVYYGSAAGLSPSESWSAEGNVASSYLGSSAATAGDVNGDGYSDLLIGAEYWDGTYSDEGRAFLWHGSASGLGPNGTPANADWRAEGQQSGARLGRSVACAGDLNGDGYADVVAGAPFYDNGQTDEGIALAWLGSAAGVNGGTTGTPVNAAWLGEVNQANAWFGYCVAPLGDTCGDSYADLIIGAPFYNGGAVDDGTVFAYYGNGQRGRSLRPFERRTDNSASIQRLACSFNSSQPSFRVWSTLRIPFGRGKAKLQWEAKRFGTPFDGSGLGLGASWTDTGTAGQGADELITVPSWGPLYHWRVRQVYNPVTTPFMPRSRWITRPWNGWQEADIRIAYGASDLDNDGWANAADCAPSDATVWEKPSDPKGFIFAPSSKTLFGWHESIDPGGTQTVYYDVLRNTTPSSWLGAICLYSDTTVNSGTDATVPSSGQVFYYLVGSQNSCGIEFGTDSSGASRTGRNCP